MSQSGDPNFDTDHLCPAGLAAYTQAFAPPAPLEVPSFSDPLPPPAPPVVAPANHQPVVRTTPPAPAEGAPLAIAAPEPLLPRHGHKGWSVWVLALFGLAVEVIVVLRVMSRRLASSP
jgi:hypothetical protein